MSVILCMCYCVCNSVWMVEKKVWRRVNGSYTFMKLYGGKKWRYQKSMEKYGETLSYDRAAHGRATC